MALYPGISCEINMSFLYARPGLLVEGVPLVDMVILLMGALFARFGVKFMWVLWGIWMFGVLWFIGLSVAFGLLRKQSVTA